MAPERNPRAWGKGGAPRVQLHSHADPVRAAQYTVYHHFDTCEAILAGLRGAFSRRATFDWFSTFVVGQACRGDDLGISSVVRALSLEPQAYDSLDGLFRSGAWYARGLVDEWEGVVSRRAPLPGSMSRS